MAAHESWGLSINYIHLHLTVTIQAGQLIWFLMGRECRIRFSRCISGKRFLFLKGERQFMNWQWTCLLVFICVIFPHVPLPSHQPGQTLDVPQLLISDGVKCGIQANRWCVFITTECCSLYRDNSCSLWKSYFPLMHKYAWLLKTLLLI